MATIYDMKTTFTGGEVAPELYARVDLAPYANGVRELTNMLVLPQGGVMNRPGTQIVAGNSGYSGARLVPFVSGRGEAYLLVFRPERAINNLQIRQGGYVVTALEHPYSASQLEDLRWLQSNDIMYLFEGGLAPWKLSRGSAGWSLEEVVFEGGPWRDMNTTGAKVKILGNRMLASEPLFEASYVGARMRVEFKVKGDSGNGVIRYDDPPEGESKAPTASDPWMLFGPSSIETTGIWRGTMTIEQKGPEDENWREVYAIQSDDNANLQYNVDVDEYGTMFRLTFTTEPHGGYHGYSETGYTWRYTGGLIARQVEITGYTGDTEVTVRSLDDVNVSVDEWTADWQWGAFDSQFGYPKLGIFHQERLVLANTRRDPQTLWMSQSASWEKFGVSIPTEDTDAITATLAAKQKNEILGLASRSDLLIFTSGAEFVAQAGSKSDVFTPSSITITPSSYIGCDDLEPLDVGPETFYVQRHAKKIRALGYSGGGRGDSYGYADRDITALVPHLFRGRKARRWAYQQDPWSVVWVVLDNGEVLALTVNQEHQVMAWSRHTFASPIKDICCLPGTNQDDLYLLAGEGAGAKILKMYERPAGYEWDGENAYQFRDERYTPIRAACELLEYEQAGINGTLQGRSKHIARVTFRVMDTCGFKAGIINENNRELDDVRFPDQKAPKTLDVPYTGDVYMEIPGGFGKQCRVRIECEEAHPVTILGVFKEVNVDEGIETAEG